MTDYGIEEIYGLVYEAFQGGQAKIQLQAFPFRMTTANLVRHEQDPNVSFWQMLKTGNDAFLEMDSRHGRRLRSALRVQSISYELGSRSEQSVPIGYYRNNRCGASIGGRNPCQIWPAVGALSRSICSKDKRYPSPTLTSFTIGRNITVLNPAVLPDGAFSRPRR